MTGFFTPSPAIHPGDRHIRPKPPEAGGWIRRLSPFLMAHSRVVVIAFGAALISMLATVVTPQIMRHLFDGIRRGGSSQTIWVAAMLGLGLTRFATAYVRRMWGGRVALDIEYDLRTAIYDHLQRLDFASHDKLQTGQLVSRSNSDVRMIQMLLAWLPLMSANALLFVLSLGFMLSMNVFMTLVAVLILPAIGFVARRMRAMAYPSSWDVQQKTAVIAGVVDEAVTGVRVVKAFGQERRELERLTGAASDLYGSRMRNIRVMSGYSAVMAMLPSIGRVAFFGLGGWLAMQGRISLGTFLAFQTYLAMLIAPVRMTTMMFAVAQQARAGGERVLELLDSVAEVQDAPNAAELDRIEGRVHFDGVRFGYLASEPVLRDFQLEVAPGETVAVVGGSGSGKSTVTALLPRFYDAQSGRITIDGIDVRDVTLESLRRQIGVVFEDSFLFSDSVRANIAYGRPDATDAEIVAAATAAEAHEFITALPAGYDTVVGERGLTLSGGQRQRVAIARALITDPQVLLLDDATSSIDVHTEEEIHQTLRRLMRGRTAILIAHRRSTLALADRIVVVDHGRVVDSGAHDELLARCDVYRLLLAGPSDGAEGEAVAHVAPRAPVVAPIVMEAGPRGFGGFGGVTRNAARIDNLPPIVDVDPDVDIEAETTAADGFELSQFVRPYRWALGVGLALVAVQAAIDLAGPTIMKHGIDSAIVPGAIARVRNLSTDHARNVLASIAAGFLAITLFDIALGRFVAVYTGRTSSRMLFALRVKIFAQLQRLGVDYYDKEMAGRLMTRMTSDVEALSQLLQDGLVNALVSLVTVVGVLMIMFVFDVGLTLVLMAVVVPMLVATWWFRRVSDAAYTDVREKIATVNASFQESVSGVRVAQAYVRERRNTADFRSVAGAHLDARLRTQRIQSIYFPFVDFLSVVGQALVIGVGIHRVQQGDLTAGVLIAFILYINTFFSPIQQLSQVFDSYQQARAAMTKIRELMATTVSTPVDGQPDRPGASRRRDPSRRRPLSLPDGRTRGAERCRSRH